MPIECGVEIERLGQERFHALDKDVMRHAFDIHNSMGRFCDERICQEDLARRCRLAGLSVERDVPLKVIPGDFCKTIGSLLDEWGAFLDANLYREALLHFFNKSGCGLQSVDIAVEGQVVGAQQMCVLERETIWHVSAVRNHVESYKTHLLRLLNHTAFKKLHWVNFDQRNITLQTLDK